MSLVTIKVFLSHRQADTARVEAIARWLTERGVYVSLDAWDVRAGDSFVRWIEAAIAEADVIVAALSTTGVGETWMAWELEMATVRRIEEKVRRNEEKVRRNEENVRLMPLMLDADAHVPLGLQMLGRAHAHDLPGMYADLVGRPRRPALGERPERIGDAPVARLTVGRRGVDAVVVSLVVSDVVKRHPDLTPWRHES